MVPAGEEIDGWVVETALGSGGMGSVYRCHNKRARRILAAIKVLDSAFRRHPEAEARFVREAEILFGLDHPNIVKVRNVRFDTDMAYIEMEFVEGQSLEDILCEGPLPPDRAVVLAAQLADAIHYLHDKGVYHRDLKPANVLVRADGRPVLVDFGLAVEADNTRITQAGTTFGTVSYAPPEWIDPNLLDPVKWDLYALGVVLFEALTGEVAFPTSGQGTPKQQAIQVIMQKQSCGALDPGEGLPQELRDLVQGLTDPDPGTRLSSASEVSDRLIALSKRSEALQRARVKGGREVPESSLTWPPSTPAPPAPREAEPPAVQVELEDDDDLSPVPGPERSERRRGGLALALVGGSGVLALLLIVAVAGGLAIWWSLPTAPVVRDLELSFSSGQADSSWPAGVRLAGEVRSGELGGTFGFTGLEPGDHALAYAAGPDCPISACLCEGDGCAPCPDRCVRGESTVVLPEGEDTHGTTLSLPAVGATVQVVLAEGGAKEAEIRLGEARHEGSEASFAGVLPGASVVHAVAGACEEDHQGCAVDGSCPVGCSWATIEAQIPWSGEVTLEIALPEPKAPRSASQRTAPPPRTSGPPGLVSNRQFASWLSRNPTYLPESAIATGKAEAGYLRGWSGAEPPAGQAGAPALSVSYAAAAAFCASRGGLASVDAEPLTWSEPASVAFEWRSAAGQPAWRDNGGRTSTAVQPSNATIMTGFRCAR